MAVTFRPTKPASSPNPIGPLTPTPAAEPAARDDNTGDVFNVSTARTDALPASFANTLRQASPSQQHDMLTGLLARTEDPEQSSALLTQKELINSIALVAMESRNVQNRQLVTRLLVKAYVQLDDNGEPWATDLKQQAALGLVAMHGPSSAREAAAAGANPEQARRIFDWAGFDERSRGARDGPSLRLMGLSGAGVPITVLDVEGSEHQAFTRALSKPPGAANSLNVRGVPRPTGHTLVEGVNAALDEARWLGDKAIVSISMGLDWKSDGDDYLARNANDLGAARAEFENDVASLAGRIDAFPGIVVFAAGNSGGFGERNLLAASSKALVAGTLDVTERFLGLETSPAIHPEHLLLTGALVFVPGLDGQPKRLEAMTSLAAPQLAQSLARVVEAGQFSAQEAAAVMLRTQEPVNGSAEIPGAGRADPIAAAAFAKCIAAARSAGDDDLLNTLENLPPSQARQLGIDAWNSGRALGRPSAAEVRALLQTA